MVLWGVSQRTKELLDETVILRTILTCSERYVPRGLWLLSIAVMIELLLSQTTYTPQNTEAEPLHWLLLCLKASFLISPFLLSKSSLPSSLWQTWLDLNAAVLFILPTPTSFPPVIPSF